MKETKSITVLPNEENPQIVLWGKFGWELQSSQEIFNKNSVNDGEHVTTTTTNYIKLVFQRDTTMQNYSQIKSLESQYDDIILKIDSNKKKYQYVDINFQTALVLLCFVIPGIFYIISKNKKKKEAKAANLLIDAEIEKLNKQADEILKQLATLVI